jgi:hypothetical protein
MFPICVHLKVPELGNTRVLLVDTDFQKRSCSTKRLERGDDSKKSHHASLQSATVKSRLQFQSPGSVHIVLPVTLPAACTLADRALSGGTPLWMIARIA